MISSFPLRCFLFAAAAAVCSDGFGQVRDPFADRDPLSTRTRNQRFLKPIDITFKVTDQDGEPVSGARIHGPGIVRPLHTQQQGTVVWKTDEHIIRDWAARGEGPLRFHAMPPKDAVMPNASMFISLSELLRTKSLDFKTSPGIRIQGRLIGQRDRQPIKNVSVVIHPINAGKEVQNRHATTDDQGEWSIVIPRKEVKITIRGHVEGYKLQDVPHPAIDYARIVEIPAQVSELQLDDFEIEQVQPLKILVTDASGKAVPNAKVSAHRQHWLDDRIVMWESISPQKQADPQGVCLLYLAESDGDVAMVSASGVVDKANVQGRAMLPPTKPNEIRVVVESLTEIEGTLLDHGSPADNRKLVLYEAINKQGAWTTIGVRAETTTDQRGHYVFSALRGLPYIVATKDRDQDGRQTIVHRAHPQKATNHRVPTVDLSDLP